MAVNYHNNQRISHIFEKVPKWIPFYPNYAEKTQMQIDSKYMMTTFLVALIKEKN